MEPSVNKRSAFDNKTPTTIAKEYEQMQDGAPSEPRRLKKRRVLRSCDRCRRMKIKCGGYEPNCSECSMSNSQRTRLQTEDRKALRRNYMERLEARILHLESALSQITPAPEQHVIQNPLSFTMAPQSKGKNAIERPATNWRDASLEASSMILSVVKEAAVYAPLPELRKAATVTSTILKTIPTIKVNRDAYERLGDDSGGLIVAIWRSYNQAEVPEEWLSAEMREILEDLTHTLENIHSFIEHQLSRSVFHVIFGRAYALRISEYREHLNYAMQRFELHSHTNINEVLMQVVRKNDLLSEQIMDPNYRLKKIDKELLIDRSRVAASAVEMVGCWKEAREEEAPELRRKTVLGEDSQRFATIRVQSLKQKNSSRQEDEVEEEEEWGEGVVVEEATSEEEDSEEFWCPVRKSSMLERNPSKLPKRQPMTFTDDDEADLYTLRSSKMGTARRKFSSTSLRGDDLYSLSSDTRTARRKIPSASPRPKFTSTSLLEEHLQSLKSSDIRTPRRKVPPRPEETEDEYTDEEELPPRMMTTLRKLLSTLLRVEETEDESTDEEESDASPPPRKSRKVNNHRSQNPSGSPPRDVGDLTTQYQGFTWFGLGSPHGSGSNSRPGSPLYTPSIHCHPCYPTYWAPFSCPMGLYGYGVSVPGASTVNSGVGNTTNINVRLSW